MARSDQRFCSNSCRLHRWRTLQKTRAPATESSQKLVDLLRSELDRLELQVAELGQANTALR